MSYRRAKSLTVLVTQINTKYPERDTASDGWIGDASHKSRSSDHNPWVTSSSGENIVTAQDIDNDIGPNKTAKEIVDALIASRDKRIKYIIYNGQICSSEKQPWKWRPYSGPNAHRHHMHISVMPSERLYDSQVPWVLNGKTVVDTFPKNEKQIYFLKEGDSGELVIDLQNRLKKAKFFTGQVDGDFGPITKVSLSRFQSSVGLKADGIFGPNTLAELEKVK